MQLVEKTSREGVDFPEIWLCPSPSFSFQRLANLGYMYIYLYLVFQLSSMSCWQFFQGRWTTTSEEGARVRESSGVFREIRKVQMICPKKFCPTWHCLGTRQLEISCWKLYNSILRVTKWMKTSHLLSTQSTSWPEWPSDVFPLVFVNQLHNDKVMIQHNSVLLFFNNVPYVMQGTHDFLNVRLETKKAIFRVTKFSRVWTLFLLRFSLQFSLLPWTKLLLFIV